MFFVSAPLYMFIYNYFCIFIIFSLAYSIKKRYDNGNSRLEGQKPIYKTNFINLYNLCIDD